MRNIVLTGFMGSGKSTVGRQVARLSGSEFIDTDELIEKRAGMGIPDIWKKHGEPHFRNLEAEVATELAAREGLVIATGGGMLLDETNRSALAETGMLVCLSADKQTLVRRIKRGRGRPLMFKEGIEQRIDELLAERKSVYDSIPHQFRTSAEPAERIARQILNAANVPAPFVKPDRLTKPVPIVIRSGLLANEAAWTHYTGVYKHVFVISNETIWPLHGERLIQSIRGSGAQAEALIIPDGEQHKTITQAAGLLSRLAGLKADRGSLVVAFGGGVVGDMTGFVASLYMRGVDLLMVPTSLLAMVDASIGGKTAVDHADAKNLAGSFHHPQHILIDPEVLSTLAPEEISNGLAEAIKTAIIGSAELLEHIEANAESAARGDTALLAHIIAECAGIKARIVTSDPQEKGLRRVLNLGHTLGHALEAEAGLGKLAHGQAVALGILCAAWIAEDMGKCEPGLLARLQQLLPRCGLPVVAPPMDKSRLIERTALDKKRSRGKLYFVLPRKAGTVEVVGNVSLAQMQAALEVIEQ